VNLTELLSRTTDLIGEANARPADTAPPAPEA